MSQPINCLWGLLCSLSSIDQEKNNISLFNIIDEINLPEDFFSVQTLKPIPLQHEIVMLWRRALSTTIDDRAIQVEVKIALLDPSGTELSQLIYPLSLPGDRRRVRTKFRVDGLPLTTPGDYVYRILLKNIENADFEEVFKIPFEVKVKGRL